LILSIFFLLCVLQLIIVGGKGNLNYGEHLASNYLRKWTAGGFIIGFFTSSFVYMFTLAGAYIVASLGLVISVALLIDSLTFLKKNKTATDPVSVQIKDKETKVKKVEEVKVVQEPKKEVNVVLNGNIKEEKEAEKKQPLTARQILGLDKKIDKVELPGKSSEPQQPKKVKEEPKDYRKMILTPPQVNIDEMFKDIRKQNDVPSKKEIQMNFDDLKKEESEINPAQVFHEDEFKPDNKPIVRVNLPDVKSEQLVEQADDILRSAIAEEKQENPDIFESVQNIEPEPEQPVSQVDPERNLLDRLPERDNSGSFERRSFDRPSFDRDGDRNLFDRSAGSDRDRMFGRDEEMSDFSAREEVSDRRDFGRSAFENNETTTRERMFNLRQPEPAEPVVPDEELEPYVYEKPPIDFITTKSVDLSTLNEDVAVKRVLLENTLETFGVPAKVQGVVVGPAVTRYELEMPQGVSVSKIKNRADDIALSLAAEGAIRIEAPIPGKNVVGIEVPNTSIATISLKDVLNSREFMESSSPLTFALGKDITGSIICCNMQKLTHLLVAGSTGSGKSVCLNSIILSIIYKASPEDVKIVLIDPKRVEFSNYEALPHLIMPNIVCETQKAISTLSWAVEEMERRFEVLRLARVKNIDEYNQTNDVVSGKIKKMPFIVIIVDELADLMMTGKKEVEEKVCRLAQKSRAAGMHLILATQRPSVDVVTGLIKSNFPSRISFAVTSAVDSMTILDRVGAEKLLGKGDMFYFPVGASEPKRVQGCFISTNEINNIVDYCRDNNKPIFDKDIENAITNQNKNTGANSGLVNNDIDTLLPHALRSAISWGEVSTSKLRSKFAIGYPRAARIIDQMEEAGYISTPDGAKPRTVYITEDEFREIFGDQYE
ncbi:MAG: DNA translocase FtsK, partial [Clostridia bacterium]|nr:DNA translocase FtsK [Clostridia bacterium]